MLGVWRLEWDIEISKRTYTTHTTIISKKDMLPIVVQSSTKYNPRREKRANKEPGIWMPTIAKFLHEFNTAVASELRSFVILKHAKSLDLRSLSFVYALIREMIEYKILQFSKRRRYWLLRWEEFWINPCLSLLKETYINFRKISKC